MEDEYPHPNPPQGPYRRIGDDLLIRIDERTVQMAMEIKKLVTKEEFNPVRNITYGLVALLLTLLLTAVVTTALAK